MSTYEQYVQSLKDEGEDTSAYENNNSSQATPSSDSSSHVSGIVGYPLAAASGILKGLGNVAAFINKWEVKGFNKLTGAHLEPVENPFDFSSDNNNSVSNYLGNVQNQYPVTTAAGNFVGEAVPFVPLFGAGAAGEALPMTIARNSLAGGTQGLVMNPDNPGEGFTLGATLGGTLGTIGDRIAAGLGGLNHDVFDSAQRLANRGITTHLDVGSNFNIPTLKSTAATLANVPFSGAHEIAKTTENLERGTNEYLNGLKGDTDPREINDILVKKLKDLHDDALDNSKEDYKNLNDMADFMELGNFVNTDSYRNAAGAILRERRQLMQQRPELDPIADKSLLKLISSAANSSDKVNFYTARQSSEKLNKMISDAYAAQDPNKARQLQLLKKGNELDFDNSIMAVRQPELKKGWDITKQNYINNVVPFQAPEIQKFIHGNGDPDLLINNFIRTGNSDRGTLADKLMSKLSPEDKNLVAYSYLTKGLAKKGDEPLLKDNLGQVVANYQKLDALPNTKQALFGGDTQFLEDIKNVHNASQSPKHSNIGHNLSLASIAEGLANLAINKDPSHLAMAGSVLGSGIGLNKILRSKALNSAIRNNSPALRNALSSIAAPVADTVINQLALQSQ